MASIRLSTAAEPELDERVRLALKGSMDQSKWARALFKALVEYKDRHGVLPEFDRMEIIERPQATPGKARKSAS